MRTKSIILILLLLFFSQNFFCQSYWEKLNYQIPSDIATISVNTDNEIFLGTTSNGIYTSDDNGNSWAPFAQNMNFLYVPAIVISTLNNTMIISHGFDIMR